jgi:hypothetical protein
VIKVGSGFPLLYEGTHVIEGAWVLPVMSIIEIPQEEGLVIIFNASIACQDPAVKLSRGSCILLVY